MITIVVSQVFGTEFKPGILSDNFGIVTPEDIQANAAIAAPIDGTGHPFLTWQCVCVTSIQLRCENVGSFPENGGASATPEFTLRGDSKTFNFYLPHAWSLYRCRQDVSTWRRIVKVGEVACFSGFYDKDSGTVSGLQRVKTKRGQWSYFR